MKKRFLTRALSVLASVLALSMLAMSVTAAAPEEEGPGQPDYSRKGSVTVDIREADGKAVGGGTLVMVPVADAVYDDGDNLFVYNEDFEACGLDLSRIEKEENGAPELAEELAGWAAEKGLKGTKKEIGSDGSAVFGDLPLGLYLFIQEKPAEGYESVHPFLVTVPLWNGEELLYDVKAGPKVGTSVGLLSIEPKIKKVFKAKRGTLPKGETFRFQMVPEKQDQPMPSPEGSVKDAKTGALTVTHGAGTFSFGKIWFGSEDIGKSYSYTIREIAGGNTYVTYDKTAYTLKLEVYEDPDTGKIVCRASAVDGSGKAVKELAFTNVYDNPPTPSTPGKPGNPGNPSNPKLPQTGQLWWPVPLLALTGLLLFGIGRIRSRG